MIFRDRPDGKLMKVPNFKKINPYMFPTRDESILYCQDRLNIDNAINMLLEMNRGKALEERVTLFHVLLTALLRSVVERPILNTFVAGQRYFKRNELSFSFVAKKELSDDGEETILKVRFNPNDTLFDVTRRTREAVVKAKSVTGNSTEKEIDIVMALPRFGIKAFMWLYRFLDYNNILPGFMIDTDPLYCTTFITNLGSIGLEPIDHHLYNWGTCGTFLAIGKVKRGPLYDSRSGQPRTAQVMDIRVSLDDRIADGYYYGNSLATFKKYVENPASLLEPAGYTKEQIDALELKYIPD